MASGVKVVIFVYFVSMQYNTIMHNSLETHNCTMMNITDVHGITEIFRYSLEWGQTNHKDVFYACSLYSFFLQRCMYQSQMDRYLHAWCAASRQLEGILMKMLFSDMHTQAQNVLIVCKCFKEKHPAVFPLLSCFIDLSYFTDFRHLSLKLPQCGVQ